MMRRIPYVCALFLLLATLSAGSIFALSNTWTPLGRGLNLVQNKPEVVAIEAYTKQSDAYVRRNRAQGRLFADTSSVEDANAQPSWREFRSRRALQRADAYRAATVWIKPASEVVRADFDLSSPSGDWAQSVSYYYRSDGTLAKIHSELRTFAGNVIVIRDRYYNPQAQMIQENTRYMDLNTRKPKRVEEGSFMDQPIEMYAKASDLPFYSLLKRR